ncbi:hypothetical protein BC835DRAFT_1454618 [Cytidiella melzeri]|nr:hypothetical protein BC835DRAFT_1454618 [Cytidiella melzeri]
MENIPAKPTNGETKRERQQKRLKGYTERQERGGYGWTGDQRNHDERERVKLGGGEWWRADKEVREQNVGVVDSPSAALLVTFVSCAMISSGGSWWNNFVVGSTVAILNFKVKESVQPTEPETAVKEKKIKQECVLPPPGFFYTTGRDSCPEGVGVFNGRQGGFGDADKDSNSLLSSNAKALSHALKCAKMQLLFTAKKVILMVASKKHGWRFFLHTANNINKWNQVQEELKEGEAPQPVRQVVQVKERSSTPMPSTESKLEYSNMMALSCLLRCRKFKTLDQLKRHNKESDMHKKNYKDPNLREVAQEKAKAAKAKGKQPKPPALPPSQPVKLGERISNVGNKLLCMMGWTEGTGLGQGGEDRVEPIQIAICAAGVGLGTSKGLGGATFYRSKFDIARSMGKICLEG